MLLKRIRVASVTPFLFLRWVPCLLFIFLLTPLENIYAQDDDEGEIFWGEEEEDEEFFEEDEEFLDDDDEEFEDDPEIYFELGKSYYKLNKNKKVMETLDILNMLDRSLYDQLYYDVKRK